MAEGIQNGFQKTKILQNFYSYANNYYKLEDELNGMLKR